MCSSTKYGHPYGIDTDEKRFKFDKINFITKKLYIYTCTPKIY